MREFSTQAALRTVRLADEAMARILDILDAAEQTDCPERRPHRRRRCRLPVLVVFMKQPGDFSMRPYLSPMRNLSASGMAFLHGGYVHPGTHCVIEIPKIGGGKEQIDSSVVRCRYAEALIHEVGIKFSRTVTLDEFVPHLRQSEPAEPDHA